MGIHNSGGRPVEYEVEPSNTDFGGPILLSAALVVLGGAFTAFGCLGESNPTLTVVGLVALVGALLADLYAYNQARQAVVPGSGTGSGKTEIADGQTMNVTFPAGSWVVFTEVGDPSKVLGVSPPIFQGDALVTLRRCQAPPQQTVLDLTTGEDHVGLDPIEAGTFV